ncbi:ABC transporter permease [Dyella telluris]|uniref:Transport permease protein n=1 Tax=Dyella telluris TaxID=2763498 RepID=A0A7G8Q7I5_9GAMM|nr:ABC transporter permease [Dyella telluris]QNK02743.1 ABC transporter permease [Dyella telluris]
MSQKQSGSLLKLGRTLIDNWDLVAGLARREIEIRYRGATMGVLWALLNPLIMLSVYTFFFTEVLHSKWQGMQQQSSLDFSLVLFPGLLVFTFFSECVAKAPTLILGNQSYVKKIVFPLQVLPVISLMSALFHALIGFLIWIVFYLVIKGGLHATVPLVIFPLLPLGFLTLGICWILAALGTYVRDITHIVTGLLAALMFLAPIFYPISALPEKYRGMVLLNPISVAVEQVRALLYQGVMIDWQQWFTYLGVSIVIAWIGLWIFQRARAGFADVL